MNILVTGGCGFIGSHLIRHLIDQPDVNKVVNLDCLTYAGNLTNTADFKDHPRYQFHRVDLRDKAQVLSLVIKEEITHVFHLAAESHVDRSISGPLAFIDTNVVGTANLLEACRAQWNTYSKHLFIHVSTDEVFGSLEQGMAPFHEESPYRPNSPYAASKAASDMLVRSYCRTYGFPAIITNCSNNYGPYQYPEKLIPVVIQCLIEKRKIPLYGLGLNSRDWIHVLDHVAALWLLLCEGKAGESYCIGTGVSTVNIWIINKLCDWFDDGPPWEHKSRSLITMVPDRLGHDLSYQVDASKIQRLGWSPAVPLAKGLRSTLGWYLDHQDWVKPRTRS